MPLSYGSIGGYGTPPPTPILHNNQPSPSTARTMRRDHHRQAVRQPHNPPTAAAQSQTQRAASMRPAGSPLLFHRLGEKVMVGATITNTTEGRPRAVYPDVTVRYLLRPTQRGRLHARRTPGMIGSSNGRKGSGAANG